MKTAIFTLLLVVGLFIDVSTQSSWLMKFNSSSRISKRINPVYDSELIGTGMDTSRSFGVLVTGRSKINDTFCVDVVVSPGYDEMGKHEFLMRKRHKKNDDIYQLNLLDMNAQCKSIISTIGIGVRPSTMMYSQEVKEKVAMAGVPFPIIN